MQFQIDSILYFFTNFNIYNSRNPPLNFYIQRIFIEIHSNSIFVAINHESPLFQNDYSISSVLLLMRNARYLLIKLVWIPNKLRVTQVSPMRNLRITVGSMQWINIYSKFLLRESLTWIACVPPTFIRNKRKNHIDIQN
jgi:hypothetical protein